MMWEELDSVGTSIILWYIVLEQGCKKFYSQVTSSFDYGTKTAGTYWITSTVGTCWFLETFSIGLKILD